MQESISVTDFLNNEYNESALYINYRSTPSYIDGLKNSGRKTIYTIKKKNIKEEVKVSALGSMVIAESSYIHGDTGIQGTIVTLSQSYCGSNNLPPLEGVGAFGTRFSNESASSRYIFSKPSDYFNLLYKKEDDCNLISQEFEGDEIEPRFYVPTLPMLLINGCTGIGVGFASKVLNRSAENLVKAIRNKLENKRLMDAWFKPYWNGFKGDVEKLSSNKWLIKGLATRNGKKVTITELPLPYTLADYLGDLRKLRDSGLITKFVDFSEDDNYKFEVTLSEEEAKKTDEQIFQDLKLYNTITECLTCIDENNAIKEYSSVRDIFEDYYKIKIEYLEKRIKSEIARLEKEEKYLKEIYDFIHEVIEGKIDLKVKKVELEKSLKEKGYSNVDKLISMPLYSLTQDKAKETETKWKEKKKELSLMKKETPKSIWERDLGELEKYL